MGTVTSETSAPSAFERPALLDRLPPVAGPALIVACVLFAMRGFVFRPFLTAQHPDILAFWLPRFCSLGDSLRAGHIPLWNPLQFAGAPFAADPQSGWLYAPAVGSFSTLSCGTALRTLIVLHPLMAGLGLYWFLQTEGLHRVASTAGGLSASMLIATSNVGLSLPFAAMLAWTPFVLVGAGGYLRAVTLPRRLGWLAFAAFAWGQVAAAHLSHGLAMVSLTTVAYLLARSARQVGRRELPAPHAVVLVIAFSAFLIAANLAILIPRIALLDRTSLRAGYGAIGGAAARAAGLQQQPLQLGGFWSGWPLSLGSAPGAYAGAAILLAVPLSIRASRRFLTTTFVAVGLIAYVLTLNALAGAHWFRRFVLTLPFGDVYLHNVGRLRYLLLLVVPVLGALGIQSLIERPLPLRRACAWLGAGAVLWLGVPLAIGAHPVRFILLATGMAAAIPALVWLARGRARGGVLVGAVLTLELLGSAVYSQTWAGSTVYLGLEQDTSGRDLMPQPLLWPRVPVGEYLASGPIVHRLQEQPGRYDTWDPPRVYLDKGYLYDQDPSTWPALENSRGMLFGIPDSMGYSPVQLTRYWSWIRAVNASPVFYNAAILHRPTVQDLRMLAVRYLIVPTGHRPPVPATRVLTDGGYTLYERPDDPVVSLVDAWTVVKSGAQALRAVTAPAFDPRSDAVLQQDPGMTQARSMGFIGTITGAVSYRRTGPEELVVRVRTSAPALVVVHDSFDSRWTSSTDGSPSRRVLAADYFLQAVPVGPGRHTIVLRYADPTIVEGLVGSGIAWSVFLAGLLAASIVSRRRRRPDGGMSAAP